MARVTLDHLHSGIPMGANLVADGATFRVWAPHAHDVHVLGTFIGWTPSTDTRLHTAGQGHWWGFVAGAQDRQHYKFWVVGEDGGGWKRDPYARELDWGAGECVLRQADFPWHEIGFVTPSYHNFVLYQLHIGVSFHASVAYRAGDVSRCRGETAVSCGPWSHCHPIASHPRISEYLQSGV